VKLVKIAAGILNQTPLDWDGNRARIETAIADARAAGASILCLPEMCISGYGCEDAFLSPGTQRMAWQVLQEILPSTAGMVVSLGLPLFHNNALFNAACLVVDGRIAGFVAKRFLAGDGIHYEPRWFKPWPNDRRTSIAVNGEIYPLGDIYFDVGGVKIGFEICEDAWVANRPGAELARRGVDVILNPSASHFAFGKIDVRMRFVLEGSRAFGVSYVYANLLGNEAGRAIYDGGALIATAGQLVAAGPRFSYADQHVTTAAIDIDSTRMTHSRTGSFQPDLTPGDDCVVIPFTFRAIQPERPKVDRAAWEMGPHIKEEEFTRAVTLALFDYLRKSRSRGFVVSLSGGADSAAVSSLCAMMVERGVKDLGLASWLAKVDYLTELQGATSAKEVVHSLLACVYQPTRNSGDVTRNAARSVAEAIGAEFLEFDVDAVVQEYQRIVSAAIGRPFDWKRDDIALQNIQARTRSPSVWLLANLRNALLLSTSNRSEAAVGYATMDGDTSGGLCPIAGIDKAYLRRWLVWLETVGPEGLGPIPALRAVNVQPPTAELRPPSEHQTDEADLMPYELLDAVERAAIRDKRTPLEILQLMRIHFPQYELRQLAAWVERFFRLWCRNQWKRERYAPSFHLDDENLDPKTWCRFPILSGGYVRELAEMWRYVESPDDAGS
jgi:NAD+ synthase (glutamine-hydrolysing)